MSCWVQPVGMGPLDALGEGSAPLPEGATVGRALAMAVGEALPAGAAGTGAWDHAERAVGEAHAARLAATIPPPVTAAPRRKRRRVTDRPMSAGMDRMVSGRVVSMA